MDRKINRTGGKTHLIGVMMKGSGLFNHFSGSYSYDGCQRDFLKLTAPVYIFNHRGRSIVNVLFYNHIIY